VYPGSLATRHPGVSAAPMLSSVFGLGSNRAWNGAAKIARNVSTFHSMGASAIHKVAATLQTKRPGLIRCPSHAAFFFRWGPNPDAPKPQIES